MSSEVMRFLQQESARLQRENQALQEQIRTLHRYIRAVAEIHRAGYRIAEAENPLEILSQCIHDTMRVIGAVDGSFSRLDVETGEMVFTIVHGLLAEQLVGRRIPSDTGVIGWVMETGETVIVNEPRQDWRFSRAIDDEFSFLTRSLICAPVLQAGKPVGVIELLNKEPQKFDDNDEILLSVLCDVAAAAIGTC